MSIASDYTAAILATLPEPAAPVPRAAGDFGRDVLCIDTLRTGRYMSGTLLVAANLYHRITMLPGSLRGSEEERDAGLGIQRRLGGLTAGYDNVSTDVEHECRKDLRVQSVSARTTERLLPDNSLEISITVSAQTTAGPLRFKAAVDSVSARFLGLEETS